MTLALRFAFEVTTPFSPLLVRCRVGQALPSSEPGPVEQR
jgi:hypothetical protein